MDKNHEDPDTIDLKAPRLAQYMHKAWKKHQNTVYWVDNFVLKKGLKLYQIRPNAIILHETLPAYCIPKVVRMETGEVINEKVYASPRLPPKISLKHDWKKESGSEVAQRPEGEVVQQALMIIAEYCEKIGHHELQAAHAEEERRILREELWRQQMEFREVHQQSLAKMEELWKFQSSTFDTLTRQKFIEDQNTIMELSGRVQELQNGVNCMNDSKDFQDAESVRSGNSHVTSRPVSFPPHPIPEGMLRHSFVTPSRREGPPSIWDTHGVSGNVFANPDASSSAPYPQELNQWNSSIEEPLHMSTAEKSERPEQHRDLRCQSGPSAKDSVIFSGGDSSKNYGADQQRVQISDLHFDRFPTPATFACWKIRFKTEVCTCSQFPTEAMQWMARG